MNAYALTLPILTFLVMFFHGFGLCFVLGTNNPITLNIPTSAFVWAASLCRLIWTGKDMQLLRQLFPFDKQNEGPFVPCGFQQEYDAQ